MEYNKPCRKPAQQSYYSAVSIINIEPICILFFNSVISMEQRETERHAALKKTERHAHGRAHSILDSVLTAYVRLSDTGFSLLIIL